MGKIRTTEGVLVLDGKDMTGEQLEASCKDRNERAKEMEIKTRYEVKDN